MIVSIDPTSSVAPYEQVRDALARAVARGALPPGTRLATVRALAADLGLAPNTVARAYRELEADGVVETRGRRGTFVAGDAGAPVPPAGAEDAAASYVRRLRTLDVDIEEAVRLVRQAYDR